MVIFKPTNLRIESILKAFLSDVEASKMELNSFKFHAKANYNSLSADLEKLKSSDVFDDVATLILKVGSLNKVVNGNQQDIEQIESDIKQLEISNKRETRYISRLESKMTSRNEDFEEFKTKLNSTMVALQRQGLNIFPEKNFKIRK